MEGAHSKRNATPDPPFAFEFGIKGPEPCGRMSLNRSEQALCDYVLASPEELSFWQDKVKRVAKEERDRHQAAAELADMLQGYLVERASVVAELESHGDQGDGRVPSTRNLSEYWLRLWAPPPPKKKTDRAGW